MPDQHVVNGTIGFADSADAAGVTIQVFRRNLPSLELRAGVAPQLLGQAVADAAGHFQIIYTLEPVPSGTSNNPLPDSGTTTTKGVDDNKHDVIVEDVKAAGAQLLEKANILRRRGESIVAGDVTLEDVKGAGAQLLAKANILRRRGESIVAGDVSLDDVKEAGAQLLAKANIFGGRDESIVGAGPTRGNGAAISFRVFDRTGRQLAIQWVHASGRQWPAGAVIFTAAATLDVAIRLEAPAQSPQPSEYQQLTALIASAVPDIPLSDLSDEDHAFLSHQLGLEQQPDVQPRLEWRRRCALLAKQANLPAEAFYGWGRKDLPARFAELANVPVNGLPPLLDKLAAGRADALRDALMSAIKDNIISADLGTGVARATKAGPADLVNQVVRRLRQRGQEPLLVQARLVDKATGRPLVNHTVITVDHDAGDEQLGVDVTDTNGGFIFTTHRPRGAAATAARRQFSFAVTTPLGEALVDKPSAVVADGPGTGVLSIGLDRPQASVRSLDEQMQDGGLQASPAIVKWLKGKGIGTLADIRRSGGLSKVADAPAADLATIRRLEALADLDRISASVPANTTLLDKGYDSVLAIAAAPRSEFISRVSDDKTALTTKESARLHVMATTQTELLNNILMRMAADRANGVVLPARSRVPTEGDK